MKCQICNKSFKGKSNYLNLCPTCNEITKIMTSMEFALHDWEYAKTNKDEFMYNILNNILPNIFLEIDSLNISVINSALKEYNNKLRSLILSYLNIYDRDSLIVGIITIKESLRRKITFLDQDNNSWVLLNEYNTVLLLLEIAFECDLESNKMYLDQSIDGMSNFVSAIALANYLLISQTNFEIIESNPSIDRNLYILCTIPLNVESMDKYYNDYIFTGLGEKIEDIEVKNEALVDKLTKECKTKKILSHEIEEFCVNTFKFGFQTFYVVNSFFTFQFETLDKFLESAGEFQKDEMPLVVIPKDKLKQCSDIFNCEYTQVINMFDFFSLHKGNYYDKYPVYKQMELKSIFETDGYYIFGLVDTLQNIGIFKKYLISGDYLEIFTGTKKQYTILSNIRKRLATNTSYVIAELLTDYGYKVPTDVYRFNNVKYLIPTVDIKKVIINEIDILKAEKIDVGDIDVLAYSPFSNTILNIEIKYFRPSILMSDLINDHRKISENEIERKVGVRENILDKYKVELGLKYNWATDEDTKTISILITPRPNLSALSNEYSFIYFSYLSFKKAVENNEI